MIIAGQWVGLGLGDSSPEIRKIKDFLCRKFRSYAGHLADTDLFDQQLVDVVKHVQRNYGLIPTGIIGASLKERMGYWKPQPPVRPIIFTIEGHLSNPFVGPCAFVASVLEQEGRCWHQPVGYDSVKLPFNNASGVNEFTRLLGLSTLDNGRPFPAGTPWGLLHFSQGAIIGSRTYLERIRPVHGALHWRHKDLKRVVAFGNPYREKDVIAPWVPDPPRRGTQGISDVRMTNTPPFWMEHSRKGDLYAENPDSETGLYRTAIYKIAAENSWSGGPAGLLQRMFDLLTPVDDILPVAQAILGGVLFLGNMQSHGGYDLTPCVEFMRGVA